MEANNIAAIKMENSITLNTKLVYAVIADIAGIKVNTTVRNRDCFVVIIAFAHQFRCIDTQRIHIVRSDHTLDDGSHAALVQKAAIVRELARSGRNIGLLSQ